LIFADLYRASIKKNGTVIKELSRATVVPLTLENYMMLCVQFRN